MDECMVCGGWMNEHEEITAIYRTEEYYFCSDEHKREFKNNPNEYL